MSNLVTSRQRYINSMASSAGFSQTQHSPKQTDRRRSRLSFCGSARVDPENVDKVGVATSASQGSLTDKAKASCLEPGSMVPSRQDNTGALAKRRLTLIRHPSPVEAVRGKRTKDSLSNTLFTDKEAMAQMAKGETQSVQKLLTPMQRQNRRESEEAASPSRVFKRRTLAQSQTQTSMQHTTLGPTAATATRKQSRWSRKKSIEAAEMAFRAQIRPKTYNYSSSSALAAAADVSAAAVGATSSTGSVRRLKQQASFDVSVLPARRHYDMHASSMMQQPMHAPNSTVSPPWATGY